MSRKFAILSVLVVAIVLLSSVSAFGQDQVQIGPITQRIIDRGSLICGVNPGLAGFAAAVFVVLHIEHGHLEKWLSPHGPMRRPLS